MSLDLAGISVLRSSMLNSRFQIFTTHNVIKYEKSTFFILFISFESYVSTIKFILTTTQNDHRIKLNNNILMLTLESRCLPVVGGGVLILKNPATMMNIRHSCIRKAYTIWAGESDWALYLFSLLHSWYCLEKNFDRLIFLFYTYPFI